jgi:hypothetical protein
MNLIGMTDINQSPHSLVGLLITSLQHEHHCPLPDRTAADRVIVQAWRQLSKVAQQLPMYEPANSRKGLRRLQQHQQPGQDEPQLVVLESGCCLAPAGGWFSACMQPYDTASDKSEG